MGSYPHYASDTFARIKRMVELGATGGQIHSRMEGVNRATIAQYISAARRQLGQDKKAGRHCCNARLSDAADKVFEVEAAERGVSPDHLIAEVLEIVAADISIEGLLDGRLPKKSKPLEA